MTDRALIAQQIGNWLPAANEHQFAQRSKLALAETFPIETLDLDADADADGADPRFVSESLQLHLIRTELGDAVAYARTRADEQAALLSLTKTSSLPALIDQGLKKLAATGADEAGISIVLQQSISLAALRLRRGDDDLICLLRIEGREWGSAVELMTKEDLFELASRQSAERKERSARVGKPGRA
jgi:hypothetical protein